MTEKCENCRFCRPNKVKTLMCRRYAPGATESDLRLVVEPDDWCGEWQWKEKADSQAKFDAFCAKQVERSNP